MVEGLQSAAAIMVRLTMRGVRLNGWQRIGIILSVLWLLVGAWFAQQAVYAPVRAGYSKCISLGVAPNICKAGMDAGIARKEGGATGRNCRVCSRSNRSGLAYHLDGALGAVRLRKTRKLGATMVRLTQLALMFALLTWPDLCGLTSLSPAGVCLSPLINKKSHTHYSPT